MAVGLEIGLELLKNAFTFTTFLGSLWFIQLTILFGSMLFITRKWNDWGVIAFPLTVGLKVVNINVSNIIIVISGIIFTIATFSRFSSTGAFGVVKDAITSSVGEGRKRAILDYKTRRMNVREEMDDLKLGLFKEPFKREIKELTAADYKSEALAKKHESVRKRAEVMEELADVEMNLAKSQKGLTEEERTNRVMKAFVDKGKWQKAQKVYTPMKRTKEYLAEQEIKRQRKALAKQLGIDVSMIDKLILQPKEQKTQVLVSDDKMMNKLKERASQLKITKPKKFIPAKKLTSHEAFVKNETQGPEGKNSRMSMLRSEFTKAFIRNFGRKPETTEEKEGIFAEVRKEAKRRKWMK